MDALTKVRIPTKQEAINGASVVLLMPDGSEIPGQKDLVINASVNEVVTATVTFVIGGFVTDGA